MWQCNNIFPRWPTLLPAPLAIPTRSCDQRGGPSTYLAMPAWPWPVLIWHGVYPVDEHGATRGERQRGVRHGRHTHGQRTVVHLYLAHHRPLVVQEHHTHQVWLGLAQRRHGGAARQAPGHDGDAGVLQNLLAVPGIPHDRVAAVTAGGAGGSRGGGASQSREVGVG